MNITFSFALGRKMHSQFDVIDCEGPATDSVPCRLF